MTTPLLEALHLSYPDHIIDIVADQRSSDLLKLCPYLGRLIHKDKNAGVTGSLELVFKLREFHYDVAIDLRSALLTLFIRCGQRGFKRRGTSVGNHAVQHHFTALASILGPAIEIPAPRLWLDQALHTNAASVLGELPAGRQLVIAPGANWPGKIWPLESYTALIKLLDNEFDSVVVVGSQDDQVLGERLCAAASLPMINLAGETALLEVAACMAQASAFVGNDSGLGHMAAALKVPTLTVFGPGQPDRYRPWGSRAEVALAPNNDLAALTPELVAETLTSHLTALAGDHQSVEK